MTTKKHKKHRHKTEQVTESKDITRTVCRQPGCRFRGQTAVGGHCFDNRGEIVEWAKLAKIERELTADLRAMRRREGKDYARTLESHYVSAMMNWDIVLDECIRLRGENARLRARRRK